MATCRYWLSLRWRCHEAPAECRGRHCGGSDHPHSLLQEVSALDPPAEDTSSHGRIAQNARSAVRRVLINLLKRRDGFDQTRHVERRDVSGCCFGKRWWWWCHIGMYQVAEQFCAGISRAGTVVVRRFYLGTLIYESKSFQLKKKRHYVFPAGIKGVPLGKK